MKPIEREKAVQLLSQKGFLGYGAQKLLIHHNEAQAYEEDDGILVLDGYWAMPVALSFQNVLCFLREKRYGEVGFRGVSLSYYEAARKEEVAISWTEGCHLYTVKEDRKRLGEGVISLPEGFYFDVLQVADGHLIDAHYTYRDDHSLEDICENIEHRPGVGLRRKDGRLVSWAMVHPDGTMGILYTLKEYRKGGLGFLTAQRMVEIQQEKGEIPCVHIAWGNEASISLTKKLGFQYDGDVMWFGITL